VQDFFSLETLSPRFSADKGSRIGFTFCKLDICGKEGLAELCRAKYEQGGSEVAAVINLAAAPAWCSPWRTPRCIWRPILPAL